MTNIFTDNPSISAVSERITRKIKRYKEENEKPVENRETPHFYLDIWHHIMDDSWMYPVIWGQPRTGKTTAALKAAFDVYEDWDAVLQSIVYILPALLQKMKTGIPHTIQTLNGLHHRVPLLIGDDWAANNNKAVTQYIQSWDIFKGAFDTLGTKMAIFLVTMNQASAMTDQLQSKYTHEIYVPDRGIAKYDVVKWKQNFHNWKPVQNKEWKQTYTFGSVPADVYKEYDEMRLSLVAELFQRMDDAMLENEGLKTFKRLTDIDVEFIEVLISKAQVSNDWMNKPENYKYKEALDRCKARSIVIPARRKNTYWYELTDFGYELYKLIEIKKQEGVYVPKAIHLKKDKELEE